MHLQCSFRGIDVVSNGRAHHLAPGITTFPPERQATFELCWTRLEPFLMNSVPASVDHAGQEERCRTPRRVSAPIITYPKRLHSARNQLRNVAEVLGFIPNGASLRLKTPWFLMPWAMPNESYILTSVLIPSRGKVGTEKNASVHVRR